MRWPNQCALVSDLMLLCMRALEMFETQCWKIQTKRARAPTHWVHGENRKTKMVSSSSSSSPSSSSSKKLLIPLRTSRMCQNRNKNLCARKEQITILGFFMTHSPSQAMESGCHICPGKLVALIKIVSSSSSSPPFPPVLAIAISFSFTPSSS